jgi:hypothetical protein
MGYDASCTLKYGGKTARGTAWLEHKDLVFRGTVRLVIPLASVKSATAHDGTLRVRFGEDTADFTIGEAASKWANRIANPPSRLDKLGVKAGMTVAAIGVTDRDLFDEARARGASIKRSLAAGDAPVNMIFYRADHRDALARLRTLATAITPDGAIWIVRPKGRPEITESETMAAGKRAGLVDVKVVSFSDTHTAEKYVIPVANRKKPRARR